MGNQQLKNRIPLGSAIDKKLAEQLKEYSKATKIPMSKLLDIAIEQFLKSTEN